jgi:hypothetical protein
MIDATRYKETIKRIAAAHQQDLDKHGATDMLSGQNFVGFLGIDDKGPFCWIKSWGVDYGKMRGESLESLTDEAFRVYDGE